MISTLLHDELLDVLLDFLEENPDFKFRLRRTNRGNKLKEGKWFLGTNEYLSIGFWEGMNWKSKVPNLALRINSNLEGLFAIDTSDSNEKTEFIYPKLKKAFHPRMGNKNEKYVSKFELYFEEREAVKALKHFLKKYWSKLNSLIENESDFFSSDVKLPIRVIDNETFNDDLQKVLEYRDNKLEFEHNLKRIEPFKIQNLRIYNYGPINYCEISNIPKDNQWVFLTGENGVGKTTILRAIATVIAHRKMTAFEFEENPDFRVNVSLHGKHGGTFEFDRVGDEGANRLKAFTTGFACYGPIRLQSISKELSISQRRKALSKSGRFRSLFSFDGYLLNIEDELELWRSQNERSYNRRKKYIIEFFQEALLNIQIVEFNETESKEKVSIQSYFFEEGLNGELLPQVTLKQLSSGYKSILVMMSDLLIRLSRQQLEILDPGEFQGVVLIDEIDIHLHPTFQKHLIEQLSAAFPNVQFIVTTHSPIPLLGAPKDSVVAVVKRSVEKGTYMERVDNKIYLEELLPNTILTSPIFGMKDITNDNRAPGDMVRTEETYRDVEFVNELNERIDDFITDKKENELIERFKNKRK